MSGECHFIIFVFQDVLFYLYIYCSCIVKMFHFSCTKVTLVVKAPKSIVSCYVGALEAAPPPYLLISMGKLFLL